MAETVDRDMLVALASFAGVTIPAECIAGTARNLALFRRHAELVAAADDPLSDPAELLRP